jgi:VPDSG-CTERM motif
MQSRLIPLILAIAGLSLGSIEVTQAIQINTITYVFTATPGTPGYTNAFDGSSVTILLSNDTVTSWNLIDEGVATANPGNSSVNAATAITSADDITFTGHFQIDGPFVFTWLGNSSEALGTGDLTLVGDPMGKWNGPAGPAGVPDSGATVELLGLALAAVALCRRWATASLTAGLQSLPQ